MAAKLRSVVNGKAKFLKASEHRRIFTSSKTSSIIAARLDAYGLRTSTWFMTLWQLRSLLSDVAQGCGREHVTKKGNWLTLSSYWGLILLENHWFQSWASEILVIVDGKLSRFEILASTIDTPIGTCSFLFFNLCIKASNAWFWVQFSDVLCLRSTDLNPAIAVTMHGVTTQTSGMGITMDTAGINSSMTSVGRAIQWQVAVDLLHYMDGHESW